MVQAVQQLSGAAVELLNELAREPLGPATALERNRLRPLQQVVLETCIIYLERSFKMLKYSATWI